MCRPLTTEGSAMQAANFPFIHRFEALDTKYVYDVNTRRILRVADAVWRLLDDHRTAPMEMDDDQRQDAQRQIAAAQATGLLLPRPSKVQAPTQAFLRAQLGGRRQQLILEVTDACNFRCRYCLFSSLGGHHRPHSGRMMPWPTAKAAVDEFFAHNGQIDVPFVTFYGGEPLMNMPLVIKCVEYVKSQYSDRKIAFSLTTNGSLLAGKMGDFLATNEFGIMLSLDGSRENHDRYRCTQAGQPTWQLCMDNLRKFLAEYPDYRSNGKLRFSIVVSPETDLNELQAFFSSDPLFTDKMGISISEQAQMGTLICPVKDSDPYMVSRRAMFGCFLDDLKSGRHDVHSRHTWIKAGLFQNAFVKLHKRGYNSGRLPGTVHIASGCIPGARRTFVDVSGDYYACERVQRCRHQRIGDVATGLDTELVRSLLEHWVRLTADKCASCWCLPTCNIGCLATVGDSGVATEPGKHEACERHRLEMGELLKLYVSLLEENPKAMDFSKDIDIS